MPPLLPTARHRSPHPPLETGAPKTTHSCSEATSGRAGSSRAKPATDGFSPRFGGILPYRYSTDSPDEKASSAASWALAEPSQRALQRSVGSADHFPSAVHRGSEQLWRSVADLAPARAPSPASHATDVAIPLGQMATMAGGALEREDATRYTSRYQRVMRWVLAGAVVGLAAGSIALIVLAKEHRLGGVKIP